MCRESKLLLMATGPRWQEAILVDGFPWQPGLFVRQLPRFDGNP